MGARMLAPLIHCGTHVGPTSDSKVYKHTRNVSSIKNQSNRHQSACCIITGCVERSRRRIPTVSIGLWYCSVFIMSC